MTSELTFQDSSLSFEETQGIAEWLLSKTKIRPRIGIICGTGLGAIVELLTNKDCFKYEDIPHFLKSTVKGHMGQLVFGCFEDIHLVCMQGRFHFYEGYTLEKCSLPVRVMRLCGINHLIISNAAGGLNPEFKVGDIMIIKDHINFMGFAGNNPLRGKNDERFGVRFPALNHAYNKELRQKGEKFGRKFGMRVSQGIYAAIGGPNLETAAELRMLRLCGADAVGMSTVNEVLTAYHSGLTIFAFSLITNLSIMEEDSLEEPEHEEVLETSKRNEEKIKNWIREMILFIHSKSK